MTDEESALARMGRAVAKERIKRGWTKEAAAKKAGISSITWKRVEEGNPVQATKRYAIEEAFGWGFGSLDNLERDRPPVVEPLPTVTTSRTRKLIEDDDQELIEGFSNATRFAEACRQRGASQRLVMDFIHDAVVLLDSVSRAVALSREGVYQTQDGIPDQVRDAHGSGASPGRASAAESNTRPSGTGSLPLPNDLPGSDADPAVEGADWEELEHRAESDTQRRIRAAKREAAAKPRRADHGRPR